MTAFTHPHRGKSFVRSTVLLLAIAGTGYVAGAFLHSTAPSRDNSAGIVRTARATEYDLRDSLPATAVFEPSGAEEWGRSDGKRIIEPRECELQKGISTACLFMD